MKPFLPRSFLLTFAVMRFYIFILIVCLMIALPAHAGNAPSLLLVIDRWWGVDYAKEPCGFIDGKNKAICEQEKTEAYNVFELELRTQFAALPECDGITVSSFGYPQNPHAAPPDPNSPSWSFSINYFGDGPAQLWQMLPPKGINLPMMQATETPAQIAKHVCTIIKAKGAVVTE